MKKFREIKEQLVKEGEFIFTQILKLHMHMHKTVSF